MEQVQETRPTTEEGLDNLNMARLGYDDPVFVFRRKVLNQVVIRSSGSVNEQISDIVEYSGNNYILRNVDERRTIPEGLIPRLVVLSQKKINFLHLDIHDPEFLNESTDWLTQFFPSGKIKYFQVYIINDVWEDERPASLSAVQRLVKAIKINHLKMLFGHGTAAEKGTLNKIEESVEHFILKA